MSPRTNISSGTPFEPKFGYSRAVKVNDRVFVSGSTAVQPDGTVVGPGDPYVQSKEAIKTIEAALKQAGAGLQDVVRTRIYITSLDYVEGVRKAHSEAFGSIRPASTLVQISGLVSPEMLVEIEVDAVITD